MIEAVLNARATRARAHVPPFHLMDPRINFAVNVVVLSESMNFPLSVSTSKKIGDRTKQNKQTTTTTKSSTSAGIDATSHKLPML